MAPPQKTGLFPPPPPPPKKFSRTGEGSHTVPTPWLIQLVLYGRLLRASQDRGQVFVDVSSPQAGLWLSASTARNGTTKSDAVSPSSSVRPSRHRDPLAPLSDLCCDESCRSHSPRCRCCRRGGHVLTPPLSRPPAGLADKDSSLPSTWPGVAARAQARHPWFRGLRCVGEALLIRNEPPASPFVCRGA